MEAVIGTTSCRAAHAATGLVLRLIDPLSADPDRYGAASTRRPPPGAVIAARRATPPAYEVTSTGPDHDPRVHSPSSGSDVIAERERVEQSRPRWPPPCPRGASQRACLSGTVPELPEVEVVRAGLAPAVTGATVSRRQRARRARTHATLRRRPPLRGRAHRPASCRGPRDAASSCGCRSRIAPTVAPRPSRHGRPLGMSGQILLREHRRSAERHERVRLDIQHPEHGDLSVVFADQRTFGSLAIDPLIPTPDAAPGGWGTQTRPCRAGRPHRAGSARPRVRGRRLPRDAGAQGFRDQAVLLDQTVLSGVGNIYADESLWAARIHPRRPRSACRRAPSTVSSLKCARCSRRPSPKAARASTRSTSTSTGSPATSRTR